MSVSVVSLGFLAAQHGTQSGDNGLFSISLLPSSFVVSLSSCTDPKKTIVVSRKCSCHCFLVFRRIGMNQQFNVGLNKKTKTKKNKIKNTRDKIKIQ